MSESQTPLYEIPAPSTGFQAEWDGSWDSPALTYEYDIHGELYEGRIEFFGMMAMRSRAERCSKVWHIDAYDTLVEVENSQYLGELLARCPEQFVEGQTLRHFMIYLDSGGSYEIVATGWRASACRKSTGNLDHERIG